MRIVLTDTFDFKLFKKLPIRIIIDKIDREEACFNLEFSQEEGELTNLITDREMLVRISDYCGFVLNEGKKDEVVLRENDRVYVVKKENSSLLFYEILID